MTSDKPLNFGGLLANNQWDPQSPNTVPARRPTTKLHSKSNASIINLSDDLQNPQSNRSHTDLQSNISNKNLAEEQILNIWKQHDIAIDTIHGNFK